MIVGTRNGDDFQGTDIDVRSPAELLARLAGES